MQNSVLQSHKEQYHPILLPTSRQQEKVHEHHPAGSHELFQPNSQQTGEPLHTSVVTYLVIVPAASVTWPGSPGIVIIPE